jgi:hypothetical protein
MSFNIPGLPALPSGVNILTSVAFLAADAIGLLTGFAASPWGIFQNGQPVLLADSVVSVGYKQDWAIADYQIEEGGFETYDKVDTPFNNRVRLASGGSQANRQALLDGIKEIAGNLELYDVVTPEQVYSSVNIQGYELSRASNNGVGLIQVDIRLVEVRVTATTQFQNTQSPTSQSQVNDGTVQPQPYTGNNLGPLQPSTSSN